MQTVMKFLHHLVPHLPAPQVPLPKLELTAPPKPDTTVSFDDLLRAMGCDL